MVQKMIFLGYIEHNIYNLNSLSKKLGQSPQTITENAKNGDILKLLSNMDGKQAEKVKNILNDREKAEKLLSSPQAQALIKKLTGEK